MTGSAEARWLLLDGDRRLEVEASPRGKTRWARLYVDGRRIAEKETRLKSVTFEPADLAADDAFAHFGPEAKIHASWDWLGDASRVAVLVPKQKDEDKESEDGDAKDEGKPTVDLTKAEDKGEGKGEGKAEVEEKDGKKEPSFEDLLKRFEEIPFAPPEGTRAYKREKFAREHPKVFAARHVALATSKVIWPLLGIGLAINLNIDIPFPDIDIPFPDIDLPSIPLPDISIPWPDIDLPDITLPGWVKAILNTMKYWVPILIAMGVAANEYERRKKQRAKVAELAAKKDAKAKADREAKEDDPEPEQAEQAQQAERVSR